MRYDKLILTVAALAVTTFVLVGCTGTNNTPNTTSTPRGGQTPAAAPQLPGQTPGVTGATNVPTKLKNVSAKRAAVVVNDCAASKNGWEAAGTVKNRGAKIAEYDITVFFTDTNSTVVSWQQTSVKVGPKKTGAWEATAKFKAPSDTKCVIAAVA